MFAEADLTRDAFLGGRVQAWQPKSGYRAATDPVFLAAACGAQAGERVLELGCGAGVASLCLAARVSGLHLTGVERQADYAELARRNAGDAGLEMQVITADLTALPRALRQESFDHIIANPPYYATGGGTAAADQGREAALREDTPLADWTDVAARRLAPKGWLTMIQAADRLPDVLTALAPNFGTTHVLPLASRFGRPARRVLLKAQKSGRGPFTLLAPMILHEGETHERDGDDYAPIAKAILRDAAAVDWSYPPKSHPI
ncbi:methyltransferase [Fontisubflavum oceani]|uniref:tRNA1(Val) (adenine(37)-N6)-methyltransferase n=1 Tax=Fontisubflavum oceani TaxID=2978973 RepID=UPI0025B283DD|nr:methyltransferase [Fontisubflavum oceani]WJY22800.1 methyltransferase [Fontisubflavum oceani]